MSIARVVIVGAGGNIGSHLVPHVGRMSEVREVVLIDPGTYESSNVSAQDITRADVGRHKTVVQAKRLRRINPSLDVLPIAAAVEDVPLGDLHADVVLACLDSRAARQTVNQRVWLLGVPWIDAGVHADGLLAQVCVYVPGKQNPCLECAWDDRDYAAIEQAYPCADAGNAPPPTGAPSSLGALAAALQAIECAKLLSGRTERAALGRRVLIDAASHKHYVTALRRNASCRMPEHEPWSIRPFRHALGVATVGDVLHLGHGAEDGETTLSVEGRSFVTRLTCPGCKGERQVFRLKSPRGPSGHCAACGGTLVVAGFDMSARVGLDELSAFRGHRLAHIGMCAGDVFTIEHAGDRRHYLIGRKPPTRRRPGRGRESRCRKEAAGRGTSEKGSRS